MCLVTFGKAEKPVPISNYMSHDDYYSYVKLAQPPLISTVIPWDSVFDWSPGLSSIPRSGFYTRQKLIPI